MTLIRYFYANLAFSSSIMFQLLSSRYESRELKQQQRKSKVSLLCFFCCIFMNEYKKSFDILRINAMFAISIDQSEHTFFLT